MKEVRTLTIADFLLDRYAEDERRWTNPALVRLTGPWLSDLVMKTRADLAAKRAIVQAHQPLGPESAYCATCDENHSYPCPTIRALAQPYADRDDFRPEWRA